MRTYLKPSNCFASVGEIFNISYLVWYWTLLIRASAKANRLNLFEQMLLASNKWNILPFIIKLIIRENIDIACSGQKSKQSYTYSLQPTLQFRPYRHPLYIYIYVYNIFPRPSPMKHYKQRVSWAESFVLASYYLKKTITKITQTVI